MSILTNLPPLDSGLSFQGVAMSEASVLQWENEFDELKVFYLSLCQTWHQKRQEEFLLGRYLIHRSLKEWGYDFWNLPIGIGEKRGPLFDARFSGSLTHNGSFAIFAMKLGEHTVGVDIESRGRVKQELSRHILTEEDERLLRTLEREGSYNRSDLLTLVFSAKESCYKGLFPFFEEYFGMKDAYFREINLQKRTFEMVVTKDFSRRKDIRPLLVHGHFLEDESNIFTYLDPIESSSLLSLET